MRKMFHPDSPLMCVLNGVTDLIILNIIWLICCIPVITIGPATTSMYYVVRAIVNGEWPPVIKTFFLSLCQNFKQSLLVFLILLIPLLLAGAYIPMLASGGLSQRPVIVFLCIVSIAFVGSISSYVYPLIAYFDNTTGNTIKNAFLLILANPLFALIITAFNLLPVVLFFINFDLMIRCCLFWLIIGCSLTAVINAKLLGILLRRFSNQNNQP